MNAAIGTKRLAIAAAALIAAAFVVLIGFAAFLPAASVRDAVKAEIRAVTGLDPVLGDEISLSLFPSGSVRFHNVRLATEPAGEPVVTADELIARLRYFPLLAGHIEIADVTLVRPVIKVAFSADGKSNWSGLILSLARALQPHSDRTASFSEIGIQNGTVIVYDGGSDATERLEGVDFQVAWPSISRSFVITPALLLRQVRRNQAGAIVISGAVESATASGRRPASVPRPSGSCIRLRRPAALLAASFVRVIQPGARARAQGLTEGRSRPPEERIGDVLLAVAGVCLGTSANVDRHDVGRPCCSFATTWIVSVMAAARLRRHDTTRALPHSRRADTGSLHRQRALSDASS